jgi:hydrogenase maturation protease
MPAANSWIVPNATEPATNSRPRRPRPTGAPSAHASPTLSHPTPPPLRVLVLGYGNELRTDDGVGAVVARTVQEWALPSVDCRVCQQLTPELAETVTGYHRVLFVDAIPADSCPRPRVTKVRPARNPDLRTHSSDPRAILALAQLLYQRCPEAWLLAVPAFSFDLGLGLSPGTRRILPLALDSLRALLRKPGSRRTLSRSAVRPDNHRSTAAGSSPTPRSSPPLLPPHQPPRPPTAASRASLPSASNNRANSNLSKPRP